MKILLDNGHGSDTPGKRSPDESFFEWEFNREIVSGIYGRLKEFEYDCEILVPETEDIPLKERCRRVNEICDKLGKNNVILVSVHANAAGDGSQWMQGRGWSCYTTKGVTESDRFAEFLYKAAKRILGDTKIREDFSDGDSDWEENFYILKNTKCPAVLTENYFYDNREDLAFLQNPNSKFRIVETHFSGICNYICTP